MAHRGFACDWCGLDDPTVLWKALSYRTDADLMRTNLDLCANCRELVQKLAYLFYRKRGFDGGVSKARLTELAYDFRERVTAAVLDK